MNMQKFTQKSIEALQEAQSVALDNQNMQIEEEHLLFSLVNQQNGFISELLKKMNVNVDLLKAELQNAIKSLPAVTGSGREPDKVYVSSDVDKALISAENEAKKMQDEYVSVEHILLGILNNSNTKITSILKNSKVDKNAVLSALKEVRGNTRVTSENPESTYGDETPEYNPNIADSYLGKRNDALAQKAQQIQDWQYGKDGSTPYRTNSNMTPSYVRNANKEWRNKERMQRMGK